MLKDKDLKKTMKRLQEDYQLEIELDNEMAEIAKSEENSEKEEDEQRIIELAEYADDYERVDDAESEEDK